MLQRRYLKIRWCQASNCPDTENNLRFIILMPGAGSPPIVSAPGASLRRSKCIGKVLRGPAPDTNASVCTGYLPPPAPRLAWRMHVSICRHVSAW